MDNLDKSKEYTIQGLDELVKLIKTQYKEIKNDIKDKRLDDNDFLLLYELMRSVFDCAIDIGIVSIKLAIKNDKELNKNELEEWDNQRQNKQ